MAKAETHGFDEVFDLLDDLDDTSVIDFECTECGNVIKIRRGKTVTCPHCGLEIDFES